METPTRRRPLTAQQRTLLRTLIDHAARAATATPSRYACPECGAETRDLPTPVTGCNTCHDRFRHRRNRTTRRR